MAFRVYRIRSFTVSLALETRTEAQLQPVLDLFTRLFAVLIGLWLPTAVLLWFVGVYSTYHVAFAAGFVSHLQGLSFIHVSMFTYIYIYILFY